MSCWPQYFVSTACGEVAVGETTPLLPPTPLRPGQAEQRRTQRPVTSRHNTIKHGLLLTCPSPPPIEKDITSFSIISSSSRHNHYSPRHHPSSNANIDTRGLYFFKELASHSFLAPVQYCSCLIHADSCCFMLFHAVSCCFMLFHAVSCRLLASSDIRASSTALPTT